MQKQRKDLPKRRRYNIPDMSAYAESKNQERSDTVDKTVRNSGASKSQQKADIDREVKQLNTPEKVASRKAQRLREQREFNKRIAQKSPQAMIGTPIALPGAGYIPRIVTGLAGAVASYPIIKDAVEAIQSYVSDMMPARVTLAATSAPTAARDTATVATPVETSSTGTSTAGNDSIPQTPRQENKPTEEKPQQKKPSIRERIGDKIAGRETPKPQPEPDDGGIDWGIPRYIRKHPYLTIGAAGAAGYGLYKANQDDTVTSEKQEKPQTQGITFKEADQYIK